MENTRRQVLQMVMAGTALPLIGTATVAQEQRGDTLRFTVLDGYSGNTLEAGMVATWSDNILQSLIFDPLYRIGAHGLPEAVMIESADVDPSGKVWTMRLRAAKWHDGREIDAEDLAYSLRRIVDPAAPKSGAPGLAGLNVASFKVLDAKTLQFAFDAPMAVLPDILATYYFYLLVPKDFDPTHPVGSGPFRYDSFHPGEAARFLRFDDYWAGRPQIAQIEYVAFSDANAAANALRSGDLDAFPLAPFNLLDRLAGGSAGIKSLITQPAQTIALTMRADHAPFDDIRVRQAMRLIADRAQMVKVALAGNGEVAADLFGHLDPQYPSDLHRERNIEQARALLADAGHPDLNVELIAYQGTTGMLEVAQIFARNALDAGVIVKVNVVPVDLYYAQYYQKADLSLDYFSYNSYLGQVSQAIIPGSPLETTHWVDEDYLGLYKRALETTSAEARAQIIRDMQEIEFERGTFIVPVRTCVADLVSSRLDGIAPAANGYPLGGLAWHKMTLI